MTTCTTSKCNSSTSAGSLWAGLIVGLAVVAVAVVISRHHRHHTINPQEETDRRINELEKSLLHLQSNFSETVKA